MPEMTGAEATAAHGIKGPSRSGAMLRTSRNAVEEAIDFESENSPEDDGDDECAKDDLVTFSESTHSLLFTENILSPGFAFAVAVAGISYASLILALWNNSNQGSSSNPFNVPVQVGKAVRGAQYLALVIGLLMEEEIPQALCLLRAISRDSLRQKLPQIKFWKFVASAMVRLVMGYIFLLNMFLVIIQASEVLEIFYDILALQFVQQIDDIAFNLAKNGLFGKRLKRATNRKYFRVEFKKAPFLVHKRLNLFSRLIYFLNMLSLLIGLATINIRQNNGHFQCRSITVAFGNEIWEKALVRTSSTGQSEKMVLLYSYFNGVYKYNGTKHGYPIYREQNKFNDKPYQNTTGALITYCPQEQAWVFSHDNIRKSGDTEESDCPWLLRSPITTQFNLLEIPNDWTVWTGIVQTGAQLSIVCDECNGSSDCNYHGTCIDKQCMCFDNEGFSGAHCEHEEPCLVLRGDWNDTWSLSYLDNNTPFRTYGRPVYTYLYGWDWVPSNGTVFLIYSGSRWFGTWWDGVKDRNIDYWISLAGEFHAFWDRIYTDRTGYVSDPTTESSPIGVDFYEIRDRGERYGPFGDLYPIQNPPGHGFFKCVNRSLWS